MTLDEALAAIQAMPSDERTAAIENLGRAVTSSIEGGESWEVFDPLECTSDMAARCWSGRRTMIVGERVCAAAFDPTLPCPHGGAKDT
jgi:hypothetical protein